MRPDISRLRQTLQATPSTKTTRAQIAAAVLSWGIDVLSGPARALPMCVGSMGARGTGP